jgi:hypothetical protein
VRGDAMTIGAKQGWFQQEDRHARSRQVERELARLELAELHREGRVSPSEKEDWERAKAGLWRSGSFAELETALRVLGHRSRYDRAAVEVVYGFDSPLRQVGPALQQRADRGVAALARLMPATIRVPAAELRRDDEIRVLARRGMTQAKIAERFGLSQQAVSKILRREAA